jgi:crossover junction endodeoxyribonuclease RusA
MMIEFINDKAKRIQLFVEGEPKAQPRVKARKMGNFISIYTPPTANKWKKQIMDTIKDLYLSLDGIHEPTDGAVVVELDFYMPRPKSHFGKKNGQLYIKEKSPQAHITKADTDNLAKAVLDAITTVGFIYKDDSQVTSLSSRKHYQERERQGRSGVEITVYCER